MKKVFSSMMVIAVALISNVVLTSCGGDDSNENSFDSSAITISCGQSVDLSSRGSNITTTNKFIASVTEKTVKGAHVGSTTLTVDGHTIPVTVNRAVTYIDDPCTSWGATKAEVRSAQKTGTEIEPASGNSNAVMFAVYSGSKIKYLYGYVFTNDKLTASSVIVPYTEASKLVDWLSEKYFLVPGTSSIASVGFDGYEKASATTLLGISAETITSYNLLYKSCYLVSYSPISK